MKAKFRERLKEQLAEINKNKTMAGRPLKYKTVEALEEAIDAYFQENPINPSVVELALHLGFSSRQSMYDYQEREEFSYTIKKAVSIVESIHEKRLFEGSCAGSIFWLKNRGWNAEESKKVEHAGKMDFNEISIDDSDE
jgi:hypothetical protein